MADWRWDATRASLWKSVVALGFLLTLGACTPSSPPSNTTAAPPPAPKPGASSGQTQTATVRPKGEGGGVDSAPPKEERKRHKRSPSSTSSAKPEPMTLEERLEAAVNNLKTGRLAYHFPERMKTGETAPVVATIGTEKVTEEQLKEIFSASELAGVRVAQTPVTPKMKMTLTSADFDITPQSSDEQIVVGTTPTEWRWTISPKHAGKLQLHLAAIIELEDLKQDFKTVDREVEVKVDAVNAVETFVGNNWQWLISGTGGLAVVGGLWNRVRRKKKVEAGDES